MLNDLLAELNRLKDLKKAKILQRFFKTGKGQYGEGDIFWGISVPKQRQIARKYRHLPLNEVGKLIDSKIHEHRLTALLILVHKFGKLQANRKQLVDFYLKNSRFINNWDLVDLSAQYILGIYYFEHKDRKILYKLVKSKNIWERRMAVIATFWFIRNKEYTDTLAMAEILLTDKEDLIHKAVGWMLREVGKRDQKKEEEFLKKNAAKMPRVMLRYAIEKFEEGKREEYLKTQNLKGKS